MPATSQLNSRWRGWASSVVGFVQYIQGALSTTVLHVTTLPYYRFLEFGTLGPIRRIATYNGSPEKYTRLLIVLIEWRERKIAELQFISIACTVQAGAVIGSFSWNSIQNAYWLASAAWYCSLVLSGLGILMAAQQIAVLNLLGPIPKDLKSETAMHVAERYLPLMVSGARRLVGPHEAHKRIEFTGPCRPRWHMVFTWQCPIMFMSYSVCTFFLGLTVLVVTPLIRLRHGNAWDSLATVAAIYIVLASLAVIAFMFCSFWIYHYVQLDTETLLDHDEDDESQSQQQQQQLTVGTNTSWSPQVRT